MRAATESDDIHGGMDGRLGLGPDRVGAPPMAAMPKCDGKVPIPSVITTFGKYTYIASTEVALTVQSSIRNDMANPPNATCICSCSERDTQDDRIIGGGAWQRLRIRHDRTCSASMRASSNDVRTHARGSVYHAFDYVSMVPSSTERGCRRAEEGETAKGRRESSCDRVGV